MEHFTQDYLKKIEPHYTGYQELHVHTVGSYRDAANTVKDVFDAAEELGRNATAITDHGNFVSLFPALKERTKREKKILEAKLRAVGVGDNEVRAVLKSMSDFDSVRNPSDKMLPYVRQHEECFVETAKEAVQFIPGIEMYEGETVAEMEKTGEEDNRRYHIIFYAKDWVGVKTLFQLCNLAQLHQYTDNGNNMPRVTMDTMRMLLGPGTPGHGHVIATSACMAGHIQSVLLREHYITQKQSKLQAKIQDATLVPQETIDESYASLSLLQENVKKEQGLLRETKKTANKKLDKKIEQAKARADKIAKQSKSATQMTLFAEEQDESSALAEAKAKLEALEREREAVENAEKEIPLIAYRLDTYKQEVREKKERIKTLEKMNAPIARLEKKLEELEEEKRQLPNLYSKASAVAKEYSDIFGEGNFYIELQDHGIMEEYLLRPQLIRIARENNIPLTVANDVHYKDLSAKRKRDILASLRFRTPIEETENRAGGDQLWFKSDADMGALFSDVSDAIANTNRIAEQCNVYYKKEMHLPQYVDEKEGLSPAEYLKKLAYANISSRYSDYASWDDVKKKEFLSRLDYELNIIEQMGFSSYISIVEDFISYAKKTYSNDAVGPGRGSGAGSLVNYLVGITDIDPLRYGLIFERFLNPERVSMPDIDTDFAPSIRDKVIDYVAEKYAYRGEYPIPELKGTVCGIYTEGQLAAKSAIRQVGSVTGVPIPLRDKIAKMIPSTLDVTIDMALGRQKAKDGSDCSSPDLIEAYRSSEVVQKLIDDCRLVEGVPVQTGVHAAGVIIADKPISEYAPMFYNTKKNMWVIQCDMVMCESDLGLLKMDFLGLRNLDIILKAKKYIRQTQGKTIDASVLQKADNAKVFKTVYASGSTDGIFQFESGGMKQTLRSFAPENIDDVILLNAAYRPGPMQYIPDVTNVKFGKKKAEYIVPEMAEILEATYGSPIYQEQIQQIFNQIAGFSLGQADIIRRAMSKKHLDELEAAKGKFVEGFLSRGANPAAIEQFWTQLLDFARYAFNKSHAAAYSALSYYTAYLKTYYPVEYFAALMVYTEIEKMELYVKAAKEAGVTILPPGVNQSAIYTAPTRSGAIRVGLAGIKGVGCAADKIIAERKSAGRFESVPDFLVRCVKAGVDRGALESIILSGSLSEFSINRKAASEALPEIVTAIKTILTKAGDEEGMTLAKQKAQEMLSASLGKADYSEGDTLKKEKEYVGFYLSGHPLDRYHDAIEQYGERDLIADIDRKKEVLVVGRVAEARKLYRKKDGRPMCSLLFEDLTGTIEAMCYTTKYEQYGKMLEEDAVLAIVGRAEPKASADSDDNAAKSMQIIIQSVADVV